MDKSKHQTVTPYGSGNLSKKEEVALMFDNISHRYDFLNHLLSMGIDKGWRRKAIDMLREKPPQQILDIATGTGDFSISALSLNPVKVTGIDISSGMLEVGRKKIIDKGLSDKIELLLADSEKLPFDNNTFDAAIVAFGVRNFENLDKGLSEIYRVLKPSSRFVVLEFSKPASFPFKQLYWMYFKYILPLIGKLISKDRSAYSYLPESVKAFPDGKNFIEKLENAGFTDNKQKRLTFGIASIYIGNKKQ